MKKINFVITVTSVALIMLLSGFTFYKSIDWEIKDDFSIEFTSDDASGTFSEMSGEISFDPENLEASKFDVQVAVSSINTGNGMKNKHAVGGKWFDAEQYPNITFVSQKFAKTADGYEALGTLEMHGVAKEFTMPFTFDNEVFTSSFSVNRLDYNVGSMKGMSKKVPAELKVDVSVPVSKK